MSHYPRIYTPLAAATDTRRGVPRTWRHGFVSQARTTSRRLPSEIMHWVGLARSGTQAIWCILKRVPAIIKLPNQIVSIRFTGTYLAYDWLEDGPGSAIFDRPRLSPGGRRGGGLEVEGTIK